MQQRTVRILSIASFAGLMLWGGYALLSYVGIPVHGLVLFTEEAQKSVSAACPDGGAVCRGFAGFIPFLLFTIGRTAPFLWYVVLSGILFLAFVGWRGVKTGEFRIRMTWRPWQMVVVFLGLVWLLFTVLSMGSVDGGPALQIAEPTQQAYGNIGTAQLASLQQNFDGLQARGCLTLLGQSSEGVKIYQLRGACVQASFVTRVVPAFLFVLALLAELLIVGRFLLRLLRLRTRSDLEEALLSAGLGACAWIAMLWLLAVLGIFTYQCGWALAVFLPVVLYKDSLYWVRTRLFASYELDAPWYNATLILLWVLVSYLALNFLTVIRPFPIGWDDLGSYLNRPRLLVSYGHFIFSMAAFQWEYLTSVGFLLFGYDSVFGATASMLVNWFAGILAITVIGLFGRTFLGKGRGVLAALIYYSLPLVGHFSFADMKIDNAVFAFGAIALYAAFVALFAHEQPVAPASVPGPEEAPAAPVPVGWHAYLPVVWPWVVVSGVFAGFAFAVKITSALVFLAIVGALLGGAGVWGAASGLVASAGVLVWRGIDVAVVVRRIGLPALSRTALMTVLFLGAVVLLAVAWVRARRRTALAASSLALFLAAMAVTVFPWIWHNNLMQGRIFPRLEFGAPNNLSPVIDIAGTAAPGTPRVRSLPAELKVDMKNPACTPTGSAEELDRYWGFRQGWGHYLTLPWRTIMNVDSAGYYVTTIPALLLFPLVLLLPYFWTKRGRWLRWLSFLTACIIVGWMFTANGILWYGIGMFLGLVIVLEALVALAPDVWSKAAAGALITLSLFSAFSMRFWQFEQQRSLLEYPFGKVSADTLRIRTIPYYDQIRSIVMERFTSMPDRPLLYRMGTFIPYFIPRNLEVIGLTDNQLDQFNCLHQERNPQLTLRRLKALGFNSMIFDTNTATIEQDPNGTLHKKAQALVDFLNNPSLGLQVVVSDPAHGVAFILFP